MRNWKIAGAIALSLTFATAAKAERLTDQPLVDVAWLNSQLGNDSQADAWENLLQWW